MRVYGSYGSVEAPALKGRSTATINIPKELSGLSLS
jgi:hypothetical protein